MYTTRYYHIHICVCVYIYVCMYVCMYVHTFMHAYIHTYTSTLYSKSSIFSSMLFLISLTSPSSVPKCTYVHIYTILIHICIIYIHTYINTYIHTYIYIYMCVCVCVCVCVCDERVIPLSIALLLAHARPDLRHQEREVMLNHLLRANDTGRGDEHRRLSHGIGHQRLVQVVHLVEHIEWPLGECTLRTSASCRGRLACNAPQLSVLVPL